MSASATLSRSVQNVRLTAKAAVPAGEVRQLASGLAGVSADLVSAFNAGDRVDYATTGQWVFAKDSTVAILDGGRVYLNFTTGLASYCKTDNQRDYYLGRAVGDALVGIATVTVQINVDPEPDYSLARDPFDTVMVGTQALGGLLPPQRYGGANKCVLSSTNQAQKVDALAEHSWLGGASAAPCIVEMAINVVSVGAGASPVFCVGIASATHATAVTSIAQYLVVRVDGNATKIQVESSDGTHTVSETDTTKTLTAGTRFEVWFDMRNAANVLIYVNGVQVLSGTTFNLAAAAAAWKLLVHLVKTATTDVFEANVDWLRTRLSQQ